ncbi:hypothetical protein MMPV_000055 [Pyropia vietnamensis]
MDGPGRPLAPRAGRADPRYLADAKAYEAAAAAANSRPVGVIDGGPPPARPTMTSRTSLASAGAVETVPPTPPAGPPAEAETGIPAARSLVRLPASPATATVVPPQVTTAPAARPRRRRASAAPASAPRGRVERPPRRRRPSAAAPSSSTSAAQRPGPFGHGGASVIDAASDTITAVGATVVQEAPEAVVRPHLLAQESPPQQPTVSTVSPTSHLTASTSLNAAAADPYVVQVPFPSAGVMLLMNRGALTLGSHGSFRYEVVTNEHGSPVLSVNAEGEVAGRPMGSARPMPRPPPLEEITMGVPQEVLASLPVLVFGEPAVAEAAALEGDDDGAVTDVDSDGAPASPASGATSHSSCVICLADYAAGDRLLVVPCGHAFHAAPCADRWFANAPACPVCRAPVMAAPDERPLPPLPLSPLTPPPPPPADAGTEQF